MAKTILSTASFGSLTTRLAGQANYCETDIDEIIAATLINTKILFENDTVNVEGWADESDGQPIPVVVQVPRKAALHKKLESIADYIGSRVQTSKYTDPTPVTQAEDFSTIAINAERLLISLGAKSGVKPDNIPGYKLYGLRAGLLRQLKRVGTKLNAQLGDGPVDVLRNLIQGIRLLHDAADDAMRHEQVSVNKYPANEGDELLDSWIEMMMTLYWNIFQIDRVVNRESGKVKRFRALPTATTAENAGSKAERGGCVAFCVATAKVHDLNLSAGQVSERIKKVKKNPQSLWHLISGKPIPKK